MPPATAKRTHAVSSHPGCSSKQKNTPPSAHMHSMTNDQKRSLKFLSNIDGGGFPTCALYALSVCIRSRRNSPTPGGNMKKDTAQITFANCLIHSNSFSEWRLTIALFTVGEYIKLPRMPSPSPTAFRNVPTTVYIPLHVGVNDCSFASSFWPINTGSPKPKPHITYPAVQRNAVGSQPCVRYITPPSANNRSPRFTKSN
mmetsp:Transcript_2736/g.10472  ORF Transcript_2736/g.10472 Transcript_2736/m.10472 type:complete len:200 (+) Transcript_2736:250-849(+)